MKLIITLAALFAFSVQVQAQGFADAYDPANWTTSAPPPSNGIVVTDDAPTSIVIFGSDDSEGGSDAYVDYTTTAAGTGAWSFDWAYNAFSGTADLDPLYVLINGVPTLLTTESDNFQQGTYVGVVTSGDVIGFRMLAISNNSGGAYVVLSNFIAPTGVLPVKLTSFTATPAGKHINLDWLTATETNSDRYEIERSADGKTFEKIGTVKAAGNTAQAQHYAFSDVRPVSHTNYYRLRQVDTDAKSTYSKIVLVKFAAHNVTAYPNPAKDVININMGTLTLSAKEFIGLYNMQGKLLQTRKATMQPASFQWNISTLPAGQYYFKIGNATVPFIKN